MRNPLPGQLGFHLLLAETVVTLHLEEALVQHALTDHIHAFAHLGTCQSNASGHQYHGLSPFSRKRHRGLPSDYNHATKNSHALGHLHPPLEKNHTLFIALRRIRLLFVPWYRNTDVADIYYQCQK